MNIIKSKAIKKIAARPSVRFFFIVGKIFFNSLTKKLSYKLKINLSPTQEKLRPRKKAPT